MIRQRRRDCGEQPEELEELEANMKTNMARPCQWHAAVDEVAKHVRTSHGFIRCNDMRQSEARAEGGY